MTVNGETVLLLAGITILAAMLAGRAAAAVRDARALDLDDAPPADPVQLDNGQAEAPQGPAFDFIGGVAQLDPLALWPLAVDRAEQERNLQAFLAMIRRAEGTAGPNGYRTMFGGALFSGFDDHPRRAVRFTDGLGRRLWTTAAGAYQFMASSPLPDGTWTKVNTWDRIAIELGLTDFTPESQDRAAVELIRERGALDDVRAGRFDAAVAKVRTVWASLPGAGYAQPERSLDELRMAYVNAGGTLA